MKRKVCIFALFTIALIVCATVTITSSAQARPNDTNSTVKWVGVWQGLLEGVPGVTLTLGNDLGDVSGTIVFTALGADSTAGNVEIVGHAVHVIMHPHVEGNTLSFQVKRPGDESHILEMSLVLADNSRGQLHCAKCGEAAPTEMMKLY
jgi:hypothetical protein